MPKPESRDRGREESDELRDMEARMQALEELIASRAVVPQRLGTTEIISSDKSEENTPGELDVRNELCKGLSVLFYTLAGIGAGGIVAALAEGTPVPLAVGSLVGVTVFLCVICGFLLRILAAVSNAKGQR